MTPDELQRYQRHLQLPGFSLEGQQKLKAAKVLLLGAGGLGCPIGLYLAAAGVGTLGIVDDDTVDLSNLQRQVAHTTLGIGQLKTQSLINSLTALNPTVIYQAYPVRITAENIASLLNNYDLVIDGSDNFSTRFLVADACHLLNKPLLSGAIHQFNAQIFLSIPHQTACYRCLYQTPPTQDAALSCTDAGVLGVLPGTIGLMMATEAIKFLTHIGHSIAGSLLIYDALAPRLKQLPLERDKNCPLCGGQPSITQIQETATVCSSATSSIEQISVEQASQLIQAGALVVDVRENFEYAQGHLPNALSLPLSELNEHSVQQLPADQPILVYCAKGSRSQKALEFLHPLGLTQAVGLEGGLQAWQAIN